MKNARTLTALAVLALALTGCGGAQEATTAEQTSTTPTSTATQSPAPTKDGLSITLRHRAVGEEVATYIFTGQAPVQCNGKELLQLEFTVQANPDSTAAPNYLITEWGGYENGLEVQWSGDTEAALSCTPSEYHSVTINPGESKDLVVVLDTTGIDELRYSPTWAETPLSLTL